ncbi:hypothetical protein [Fontivita pretiosa]|uniref:hypothetical protein n=1 Tax=Fontivita pretiosa TaxID=2989684 RepID=UPI003D18112C
MIQRLTCIVALALLVGGCATTRVVTISTKPADATISIDGVTRGRGPVTETFTFSSAEQTHRVVASRMGYKDTPVTLNRDYNRPDLLIELKPLTRVIHITVAPVPAIISVDGKPITSEPVTAISKELEFTVDSKNQWITHTITAERPNYDPAVQTVSWTDRDPSYTLLLQAKKKNLNITTEPPGAEVLIDYEKLGVSPVRGAAVEFPVDPASNEFVPRKLRAEKPGYMPGEITIAWDNGRTDYHVDLGVYTKDIRIVTDPPGAVVKIDGHEIASDRSGTAFATLQFPPVNEKAELKTYTCTVSKKTADSEWEPQSFTIGWENGRTEYRVTLKEILTRPVKLLMPNMRRTDDGWEVVPEWVDTIAMKDVTEPERPSPQQLTRLAKGTQIGSLAVSPDGTKLVFSVLSASPDAGAGATAARSEFRSQLLLINTDGSGGASILTDGKSLDLMPWYSPRGDQILFSSNRSARKLQVHAISADGAPGITRLTTGDTNDLWPTIDSDPKPRLFYQAMVDTRADPRLYMTQLGTIFQTDLTTLGGTQPRVSPRNDAIIFAAVNEKTGKRDIFRVSDGGGVPQNLTNTPDADECDPSWSRDGSKIVFASDRATADGRNNYDIWMLDLSNAQGAAHEPVQITANASHDDCPVFDLTGNSVFFRSNRGGQWQIWNIAIR